MTNKPPLLPGLTAAGLGLAYIGAIFLTGLQYKTNRRLDAIETKLAAYTNNQEQTSIQAEREKNQLTNSTLTQTITDYPPLVIQRNTPETNILTRLKLKLSPLEQ